MDKELKDKLESLKSDGKKKKGCTSCKKKKEVLSQLPPLTEIDPIYLEANQEPYFPTKEVIHLAYVELGNRVEDKREFINGVYKALFNEDFNFNCSSCSNESSMKLRNYVREVLNIPV